MQLIRNLPPDRRRLCSFVVVADTHVNETERGGSSPFQTNDLANARARYVFNEIAAMGPTPDFVVHLGDIVNVYTRTTRLGRTSLTIEAEVEAERCPEHSAVRVTTATLTMVALDDSGRPTPFAAQE